MAPFVKRADAVIHTAAEMSPHMGAIDRQAVAFLLDAVAQSDGLRRFVYTSGVWVLGDTGGKIVDESASTKNAPPVVAWRPAVEDLVGNGFGLGITAWIIRPGIVYGGPGGITAMLFASAEKEGAIRIVGDGRNHWPLVHRGDLADLYVRCVEQAPAGHVFNATDGSRLTLWAIAESLSPSGRMPGKGRFDPTRRGQGADGALGRCPRDGSGSVWRVSRAPPRLGTAASFVGGRGRGVASSL